jgi:hypothetical protein
MCEHDCTWRSLGSPHVDTRAVGARGIRKCVHARFLLACWRGPLRSIAEGVCSDGVARALRCGGSPACARRASPHLTSPPAPFLLTITIRQVRSREWRKARERSDALLRCAGPVCGRCGDEPCGCASAMRGCACVGCPQRTAKQVLCTARRHELVEACGRSRHAWRLPRALAGGCVIVRPL